MEAVIIGNPNLGSAGDEGYLERFAEALRAGGLEIEVLNTERPDHGRELRKRWVLTWGSVRTRRHDYSRASGVTTGGASTSLPTDGDG
jgi:hypothetical protein